MKSLECRVCLQFSGHVVLMLLVSLESDSAVVVMTTAATISVPLCVFRLKLTGYEYDSSQLIAFLVLWYTKLLAMLYSEHTLQ